MLSAQLPPGKARLQKDGETVTIEAKLHWRRTGDSPVCSAGEECANTFIEIMVGIWLLTLMIVGIYGAFSFGFSVIKVSQEDTRADQILLQKVETLRVYDWSRLTNGYFPTNFPAAYSTNGGVTYQGTIAIKPAPMTESYSNSLRQVTVSLSWVSTGVPRSRTVTTLVSENGIQTYKP